MSVSNERMVVERASNAIAASRVESPTELAKRGLGFVVEPYDENKQSTGDSSTTETNLTAVMPAKPIDVIPSSSRILWVPASAGLLRIGRDKECEIVLPHPQISKHHALLQRTIAKGVAHWILADQRSTNGTMLNGTPLEGDESRHVGDGDRIALGKSVVLRPYFTSEILHALLRAADKDYVPPHETHRETLERLTATFRALGLDTTFENGIVEVASLKDASRVRLSVEPGAFVIENTNEGVTLKRQTVSPHDTKAEDTVRSLILGWIDFST